MTNEDVQALMPIIENAGRLIDDATLLAKASGFPSAFVLNVIALEEIGKAIQMRWNQLGVATSSQKRSAHLQKQWAVACVLIGDKTLPFYKRILAGKVNGEAGMIELATAFIDSKERRFLERVAAVELDRSKQVGLYEDGVTIAVHSRDQMDAEFVLELSVIIGKALPMLMNDSVIKVGGIFFEIMPKLTDQILAQRYAH